MRVQTGELRAADVGMTAVERVRMFVDRVRRAVEGIHLAVPDNPVEEPKGSFVEA